MIKSPQIEHAHSQKELHTFAKRRRGIRPSKSTPLNGTAEMQKKYRNWLAFIYMCYIWAENREGTTAGTAYKYPSSPNMTNQSKKN